MKKEEKFGLFQEEEINEISQFDIGQDDVFDPTGVNWKTGVKAALAGGGVAAAFLPAAAAAAV